MQRGLVKEEEESLSVSAVSTVSALCLIQFLLEFFFFSLLSVYLWLMFAPRACRKRSFD